MHPAVVRCDAHADFLGAIKELAKTSSGANELNVSRTIDEVYLFIRLMADEFSRRNVGSAVPTAAQWAAITAVR